MSAAAGDGEYAVAGCFLIPFCLAVPHAEIYTFIAAAGSMYR